MELKQFVEESLKQIIFGVKAAQDNIGDVSGANINPPSPGFAPGGPETIFTEYGTGNLIQSVEFDVAVTTTNAKQTEGGIAIVNVISVGSRGKSDSANESVSRIRFTVPIVLPAGEKRGERKPTDNFLT